MELDNVYKVENKNSKIKNKIGNIAFSIVNWACKVSPHVEELEVKPPIKTIKIELDSIEKAIHQQVAYIYSIGEEPDIVLLGGDQLGNYIRENVRDSITIRFPYEYESNYLQDSERIDYKGIEVRLVPWLDGVVVVPKGKQ